MSKQDSPDVLVIRKDGYIKIPRDSYLIWLPLFYALPKELAGKRPAYLDLPRNTNRLLREERYRDMVNCDSFLELVWDCYAWAIWQFLQVPAKDGSYKDIPGDWSHYSGDFPLWRLCYGIIQPTIFTIIILNGWKAHSYKFSKGLPFHPIGEAI